MKASRIARQRRETDAGIPEHAHQTVLFGPQHGGQTLSHTSNPDD